MTTTTGGGLQASYFAIMSDSLTVGMYSIHVENVGRIDVRDGALDDAYYASVGNDNVGGDNG